MRGIALLWTHPHRPRGDTGAADCQQSAVPDPNGEEVRLQQLGVGSIQGKPSMAEGWTFGVGSLEDHPASSEVLEILCSQEKPRPALARCLLSTRLGVGPVKGQGLKIQLFTLMEQSSAKGEGRKV